MGIEKPHNPSESVTFKVGDRVTIDINSLVEYDEFIGNLYYGQCSITMERRAAELIKQASRGIAHDVFEIVEYVPEAPGYVQLVGIKHADATRPKPELLSDPHIKAANEEFRRLYDTDLVDYLYSTVIFVDAAELTKHQF